MGMRMPETCWAVFKRQAVNLRSCCILLVDSVEKNGQVHLVNATSIYRLRNNSGQYCLKTRIAADIQTVDEEMLQRVWNSLNIFQIYCLMRTEWCARWMCWKLQFVSQMTLTLCMHPVYTFGCHFRDNLWSSHRPHNSYVCLAIKDVNATYIFHS